MEFNKVIRSKSDEVLQKYGFHLIGGYSTTQVNSLIYSDKRNVHASVTIHIDHGEVVIASALRARKFTFSLEDPKFDPEKLFKWINKTIAELL
jgi:hypothetical protein